MVCAWGAIAKPAAFALSDQLYGKTALAPYSSTDCGAVTVHLREGGVLEASTGIEPVYTDCKKQLHSLKYLI